jgi:enoyl-CoA hydratase/carnithine racemase
MLAARAVRSLKRANLRSFTTLQVSAPAANVTSIVINRPEKSNAMNKAFFQEIGAAFREAASDNACRAIMLGGAGKYSGFQILSNRLHLHLFN